LSLSVYLKDLILSSVIYSTFGVGFLFYRAIRIMATDSNPEPDSYDVIIAGGGSAGVGVRHAPLLEALNLPDLRPSDLGYADDINLLTYSKSTAVNCTTLESVLGWRLNWASTHGMRFTLQKYTLTLHWEKQLRPRSPNTNRR
jgi:hypothetical protein